MEGKATNRHVFLRMVREVEMSRDWFRSVFIVNLNIFKVFTPGTRNLKIDHLSFLLVSGMSFKVRNIF